MSYFKNHWKSFLILLFVLCFPVLIALIYKIPCEQILPVGIGDLLNYYGMALGIMGAFIAYSFEKEQSKRNLYNDDKPHFHIKVIRIKEYYKLVIINDTVFPVRDMYLFDEYIAETIHEKNNEFEICFDKTNDELEKMKRKNIINISIGEIIDNEGYPKNISIHFSDDRNNKFWTCIFSKRKDNGRIFYYPEKPYYEEL